MTPTNIVPPSVSLERVTLELPVKGPVGQRRAAKQPTSVGGLIEHKGSKASIIALHEVTLAIQSGTRLAVVGHNGAGKTSLLRVIAGIYHPTSGRRTVRGRVAAMLSGAIGLSPHATGTESVYFACALYGIDPTRARDLMDEVSTVSGLGEYMNLPISTYSSGMRSRLGFSIVTSVRPDVLVIDEMLSTGDGSFRERARQRILALVADVKVLVLASHSLDFISKFCDSAIYLEHGQILQAGSCKQVWDSYVDRRSLLSRIEPSAQMRELR